MSERCQFYMEHKKRKCRFMATPGKAYCGVHLFSSTGEGQKRVPCPIDPAQFVARFLAAPTYSKDIHAGSDEEPDLPECSCDVPSGRIRTLQRVKMANSLGLNGLLEVIGKVESAWASLHQDYLEKSSLAPQECLPYLEADGWRPFSKKHAVQQASMIGNMMECGILKEEECVVIEFGAGRGYLSSMIADATNSKVFYLVDSASPKLKADRSLRKMEDIKIHRIRSDIKNFYLGAIPELSKGSTRWIGCGKHLCGAATDYTLRACLANRKQASESDPNCDGNLSGYEIGAEGFQGIAIATCCHHRCTWQSFVGKDFFRRASFSPCQFELVSWMTGWSLCGHGGKADSEDEDDSTSESAQLEETYNSNHISVDEEDSMDVWRSLSVEYRMGIGQRCKRLIDVARLSWIRELGFIGRMVEYVPPRVSPENKLLLVTPKRRDHQTPQPNNATG